jgi:PAS domain S-box-containing protein
MLGWSASEALGRPFYELVSAPESLSDIDVLKDTVRRGNTWRGEYRLKHRDGHTIPVLASVTPVLDDDDNLVGVIGAYADISELKATEDELRFHKHIVDAVGQAVIANDLGGNRPVSYWNHAAEQMLGWSAEEALGQNVLEMLPAPGYEGLMREVGQRIRLGETWQGELGLRRNNGETIPAIANVSRIQDETGEFIGVIAALTDISELKATEEELRFNKHIVDAVGQAVVVSDTEGTISYWNRAAEEIYGWTAEEASERKREGLCLLLNGSEPLCNLLSAVVKRAVLKVKPVLQAGEIEHEHEQSARKLARTPQGNRYRTNSSQ